MADEMNKKDFENLDKLYNRLHSATNIANRPMFGSEPEAEIKVQVYPDKSVSPAKFIENKTIPGTYRAHPTTIAAMRPDIFAGANDEPFIDLELKIRCEGCNEVLDVQFWKFCPYCEKHFPKDLHNRLKSGDM